MSFGWLKAINHRCLKKHTTTKYRPDAQAACCGNIKFVGPMCIKESLAWKVVYFSFTAYNIVLRDAQSLERKFPYIRARKY